MAVIDSNNFITHLVWSGLIDKATCGELKEAIELCTVKDIYTKADMIAMLEELQVEIKECVDGSPQFEQGVTIARNQVIEMIQEKIDKLKENC